MKRYHFCKMMLFALTAWVALGHVAVQAVPSAHPRPHAPAGLAPWWMQLEPAQKPSRRPASLGPSLHAVQPPDPVQYRLFVQAEPRWYREPASLPAQDSESPRVPWINERAPAHPADGMWRSYDSPALSR